MNSSVYTSNQYTDEANSSLFDHNAHSGGNEICASPRDLPLAFDWLHFETFLAYRDIRIISPCDLNSPETGTLQDFLVGGEARWLGKGGTMSVIQCSWKSQIVAVKVPRTLGHQGHVGPDRWKLMYDLFFEIQMMSHVSLINHPNIVKLIGLSYPPIETNAPDDIPCPLLVVEAAQISCPDLQVF